MSLCTSSTLLLCYVFKTKLFRLNDFFIFLGNLGNVKACVYAGPIMHCHVRTQNRDAQGPSTSVTQQLVGDTGLGCTPYLLNQSL